MNRLKGILLFIILVCPVLAFADDGHHGASVSGFLWRIFIFVIFVALLYFLLNKRLKSGLSKSVENVKNTIEEAEKACADAEKELAEYVHKMEEMDNELEQMKLAAKATSEKEMERIVSEGEKTAEKMRELAKTYIDTEMARAKSALKAEIATLALEEAENRLRADNDEASKREYIKNNIKKIGA